MSRARSGNGFEDYGPDQYCGSVQVPLTTPGINIERGEYEPFGVPAGIRCEPAERHREGGPESILSS